MNKKSVLVIGNNPEFFESKALLKAAKKQKLSALFLEPKHLEVLVLENEIRLLYKGKNITKTFQHGQLIFRGMLGHLHKSAMLALLAKKWHIPHLDSLKALLSSYDKSAYLPTLSPKVLKLVPTIYLENNTILSPKTLLKFPVLIKPAQGQRAQGIRVVRNQVELKKAIPRNHPALLVQKYLQIDEEYRIFAIGKKIIGAIRRPRYADEFAPAYVKGGEYLPVQLPKKIEQDVLRVVAQRGIDVAGVDIAKTGEDYYLLEINRSPGFRVFSRVTGIDISGFIIDFLASKKIKKFSLNRLLAKN